MVVIPILRSSADELDIGLNVSSVISLSLSSNAISINAPVGGGFGSASTDAIVLTNSAFGYTLAIEDADNNTSLTSTTSDDVVTSSYLGSKTSETFENNTWGFSIDGTKFYAVPKKNSPLILAKSSTATPDEGIETTVTFGAKTSSSLTSGTYTDRIVVSAYSNGVDGSPEGLDPNSDDPIEVSDDIPEPYEEGEGVNENKLVLLTSMQDPRLHQYCEETYTPLINELNSNFSIVVTTRYFSGNRTPRATVKDKRDGNKYYIAKLPDGNCWMTQNLRIINTEISSKLSDLPSDTTWTVPASSSAWNSGTNVNIAYIDAPGNTYGGYYSFYAATAGWGSSAVASGSSPQSICPKGWKLPTGGSTGEYQVLHNTGSSLASTWLGNAGYLNYAGVKYGANIEARGSQGRFWTGTVQNSSNAYYYHISANYNAYMNQSGKSDGNSVRCIAR